MLLTPFTSALNVSNHFQRYFLFAKCLKYHWKFLITTISILYITCTIYNVPKTFLSTKLSPDNVILGNQRGILLFTACYPSLGEAIARDIASYLWVTAVSCYPSRGRSHSEGYSSRFVSLVIPRVGEAIARDIAVGL